MKLRDYVYDEDRKKATIWLDEIEAFQLENILMILREDEKEPNNIDMEKAIFDN